MIHKYFSDSIDLSYVGISIKDIFLSETLTLSNNSWLLRWRSELSDRCFTAVQGVPSTQKISVENDVDGVKTIMFRKGLYPTDVPYYKLVDNASDKNVLPLGSYLTNVAFTIQMTCTFEEFSNYRGLMGLHYANNPTGIVLGQYESGNLKFGFYPVTVNGVPNQAIAASIPYTHPAFQNKFNFAITYANQYHLASGLTEPRFFVYINGDLYGSYVLPAGWSFSTSTLMQAQGLSLGFAYWASGRHFKGNIYSILTYNRLLSPVEIQHNYLVDKMKYLLP